LQREQVAFASRRRRRSMARFQTLGPRMNLIEKVEPATAATVQMSVEGV
jgi:hypothetical protein